MLIIIDKKGIVYRSQIKMQFFKILLMMLLETYK